MEKKQENLDFTLDFLQSDKTEIAKSQLVTLLEFIQCGMLNESSNVVLSQQMILAEFKLKV